jgi:hypothetical protein
VREVQLLLEGWSRTKGSRDTWASSRHVSPEHPLDSSGRPLTARPERLRELRAARAERQLTSTSAAPPARRVSCSNWVSWARAAKWLSFSRHYAEGAEGVQGGELQG